VFRWHNWYRDWRIVLSLIYTVVIATTVPYYSVAITLKMVPATEMTLVSTLKPIFGALSVKIIVGERLGYLPDILRHWSTLWSNPAGRYKVDDDPAFTALLVSYQRIEEATLLRILLELQVSFF
jgi:hypothetical protein